MAIAYQDVQRLWIVLQKVARNSVIPRKDHAMTNVTKISRPNLMDVKKIARHKRMPNCIHMFYKVFMFKKCAEMMMGEFTAHKQIVPLDV